VLKIVTGWHAARRMKKRVFVAANRFVAVCHRRRVENSIAYVHPAFAALSALAFDQCNFARRNLAIV
jgi:hypothetical protein